jgi:hypothetical protein
MSSKIIIIATILLLIISFSVLFVIETKNHGFDYNKAWSVVYFENPSDNSLDFAIENHEGEGREYIYEVLVGEKKVAEEKIEIEAGQTQKIIPVLDLDKIGNVKISIEVSSKDLKYGIYKLIK